ncbi:MAG: four helix bundle protein [Vicinamibacterales bacterium]
MAYDLRRLSPMEPRDLKERSMRFAVSMAALCRETQREWPGRRLADQMFRSSTSVAANYHAACRARSRREFIAKLGLVVEEAEETVFWLEFGSRAGLTDAGKTAPLIREARELLAIFTASAKTAASSIRPRR